MSYSRIGEDSDVYVWADEDHINMVVRQNLSSPELPAGVLHRLAGKTWDCDLRSDAYYRLSMWEREGVRVPREVFIRLYHEIDTLGDKVDIW